jgi:regulator of protease activity HflC (stomatin/prohibitin superfamily)
MDKPLTKSRYYTQLVRGTGVGGDMVEGINADGVTQWLHPGHEIVLHRDEAEGYYLNITSPDPKVFVMWRMAEPGADPAAFPPWPNASPKRLSVGSASEVVVAAGAGRFGHELEQERDAGHEEQQTEQDAGNEPRHGRGDERRAIRDRVRQTREGVLVARAYGVLPDALLEVERLDIKTKNYTMSGVHDEGMKQGDDAIRALTSDGLEVIIDLTVLYKLLPADAPKIVRETGLDYTDKIVRPITRTKIRDNAVYYEAVALYSTKRDEFQARIFKSIETDFKKRGLLLEQLLIRNITLPQAVRTSIEQKISAEQDAQKMQFVLQKERQEAECKRVEAQGISDYQRIISESLTDRQLQYESIKAQLEVAKSPNAKVIIMGKGNAPIILDTKSN